MDPKANLTSDRAPKWMPRTSQKVAAPTAATQSFSDTHVPEDVLGTLLKGMGSVWWAARFCDSHELSVLQVLSVCGPFFA